MNPNDILHIAVAASISTVLCVLIIVVAISCLVAQRRSLQNEERKHIREQNTKLQISADEALKNAEAKCTHSEDWRESSLPRLRRRVR